MAAARLPPLLGRLFAGACVVLGLAAAATVALLLLSSGPAKADALPTTESTEPVGPHAPPAFASAAPRARMDSDTNGVVRAAPGRKSSGSAVVSSAPKDVASVAAPAASVTTPGIGTVATSAPDMSVTESAVQTDPATSPETIAPSSMPLDPSDPQLEVSSSTSSGSGVVDGVVVGSSLTPPTTSETKTTTAATSSTTPSTTVTRALDDDTARVPAVTSDASKSSRAANVVTVIASNVEAAMAPHDANPARDPALHAPVASLAHLGAPADTPVVPVVPQIPAMPEIPAVPPVPAPVAPSGASHSGNSGSSSNDVSRSLQLLLYAVGVMVASLELARGRHILTLRSGAANVGFVPILERPG